MQRRTLIALAGVSIPTALPGCASDEPDGGDSDDFDGGDGTDDSNSSDGEDGTHEDGADGSSDGSDENDAEDSEDDSDGENSEDDSDGEDGEDESVSEPDTQSFEGRGDDVIDGLEIEGGLTVVKGTHDGDSNFQVQLFEANGDDENGTGYINHIGEVFQAENAELVEAGEYQLDVTADGNWKLEVSQPRATQTDALSPPVAMTAEGSAVFGPYYIDGRHTANGTYVGESNFQVQAFPMKGSSGEDIFNETGEYEGEATFFGAGVVWIDVNSDDSWSINIRET